MEILAIVGRPNVGKSSLFNRIVGRKRTIVDERAGVTRDRIYSEANLCGKNFIIIDTGGFEPFVSERIKDLILRQSEVAIGEADKVIALFDVKTGLLPDDFELVERLRKSKKDVFYVVNKIDSQKSRENIYDFYSLGIDNPHLISATHGTGVNDLLRAIAQKAENEVKRESARRKEIGLAVVGRPNVGKSSIVNQILKYERVMVDEKPGTTRDSVDTQFMFGSRRFLLIDTAGIRRRSKIEDKLEAVSVIAALRAIERAKYVVLVIDASREISTQDLRIANYSLSRGRALLVLVNKIDLIENFEQIDFDKFKIKLTRLYPGLSICPFVFASALLGTNMNDIMEEVENVDGYYNKKIETKNLNKYLKEINVNSRLGFVKGLRGVRGKIKYITQTGTAPPRFLVFCNNPRFIRENHDRFIKNQIRKEYVFQGVPIIVSYRKD